MSADNQILILEDIDGQFRVAHVSASDENFDDPEWVFWNFRNSEVFHDEEQAIEKARKKEQELEKDGGWVEYGINSIEINFPFPRPLRKIKADIQGLFAAFGFLKSETPWIPLFFAKYGDPHILILSGEYGTSIEWVVGEMKKYINNLEIEEMGE